MSEKEIKLTIESRLENVFLIGLVINRICSYMNLSEEESYHLEISVVEAVNNAIKHAYGNEPGHYVEVVITLYKDRIELKVCDTGKRMEPGDIPGMDFDPDDRENLPEGGMGLFIMHEIMDSVVYESSEEKNVLTLTKFLANI